MARPQVEVWENGNGWNVVVHDGSGNMDGILFGVGRKFLREDALDAIPHRLLAREIPDSRKRRIEWRP